MVVGVMQENACFNAVTTWVCVIISWAYVFDFFSRIYFIMCFSSHDFN